VELVSGQHLEGAGARAGAQVLEVGCGPGHLSIRLARHGFQVTGLDLDPAMIARAQANADRPENSNQRRPSLLIGDAASLAFPDRSFDLVVSTLSMHHWGRPDGRTGRDRSRAPPRRQGAHLGLPARRPATPIRTTARPHARPHRTRTELSTSGGEDHALALAVQPHTANRADPRRWVTRAAACPAIRLCVGCSLIIHLFIQTILLEPSGAVWTDDAGNVSRPDPSGAV
jgi:SAM-dependent methyltransferase